MITDAPAVLLVEDHPDDEELTLRGLRRANFKNPVDVARDGQEAVDYLFGNHDQAAKPVPVVVLLDLMLPRVDGFEVLTPCNMPAEIAPPTRRLRHPTGAATRRALPLSP